MKAGVTFQELDSARHGMYLSRIFRKCLKNDIISVAEWNQESIVMAYHLRNKESNFKKDNNNLKSTGSAPKVMLFIYFLKKTIIGIGSFWIALQNNIFPHWLYIFASNEQEPAYYTHKKETYFFTTSMQPSRWDYKIYRLHLCTRQVSWIYQ